jgi:hypothetical protein
LLRLTPANGILPLKVPLEMISSRLLSSMIKPWSSGHSNMWCLHSGGAFGRPESRLVTQHVGQAEEQDGGRVMWFHRPGNQ